MTVGGGDVLIEGEASLGHDTAATGGSTEIELSTNPVGSASGDRHCHSCQDDGPSTDETEEGGKWATFTYK